MNYSTTSPSETKEIPLTQGKVALVDASDFDELSQYKWYAFKHRNTWYATRHTPRVDGKRATVSMHNVIMGAKGIDHRDGNGLNNTRDNLRFATTQQNNHNAKSRVGGTSTFKGVSWHKRDKKWVARIGFNGKRIQVGHFDDELEAATAYDAKARELFGEFAWTNGKTRGVATHGDV